MLPHIKLLNYWTNY